MILHSLLLLGAKMATAALIVVSTSVLAERSRPFLAAMLATLPISAGPALAFLAAEHPPAFIEGALLGALVTNIATGIYCLIYAHAAQRFATLPSLLLSLSGWALIALVLQRLPWSFPLALAASLVVYPLLIRLVRPFLSNDRIVAPPRPWFAIPLRALAVGTLVATVTGLSWTLGPSLSGLLTVFPIVLSSLVAILQPRIGGAPTVAVIASGLPGLMGFALALALAGWLVAPLGSYPALAIGLAACLAWNGALVLLRRR
ncbi:MAG: hypothetical protein ACOVOC_13325 [Rhabdaerophilum sp.]|jgi:hypothetical protein